MKRIGYSFRVFSQPIKKRFRLFRVVEYGQNAIPMLIKKLLPLRDLEPQGTVVFGDSHDMDLRVFAEGLLSLLFPKLKNVAGQFFTEAHIKDSRYREA